MPPRQRLARFPGTTPAKLRRARELRRKATPAEQQLWTALRNDQLTGHHFRRQHILAGYIVDFCCIRARVIVEIDGAHHADQTLADTHRTRALERLGFRVLRFNNSEVLSHLPRVLEQITVACVTRPATPSGLGPDS